MDNLSLMWEIMGPDITGIMFGVGWWFWVNTVICSTVKVSFLHYLPGIFASLAAFMFNYVSTNDVNYDYHSPYGDSEWREIIMRSSDLIGLCGTTGFWMFDCY
ncbi:hypothetical protein COCNU_13G007700 [Cocos nucifera]|uniref:Uncharacterized protein n=1 Tax=Cocos nucifera TaxID=13894 RepID=A0A8K0ITR1_COCNU|nr:hypothetical protein COCNU_13G007700 [Cocos nucifera]